MPMLHHAGLTVSDLNRSLQFWPDAMDMQVLFEQEKIGGYLEAIVGEPGAHVRMAHLEFEPFSGPVTIDTGVHKGGRGLYLRDPDGHVVDLFERAAA